jgi:catechol 2,3-dioxygenase-like lactoylglutathione lyase family enzyme
VNGQADLTGRAKMLAMAEVPRPDVECELQHPALRVPDLRAAVDFYTTRLGFTLGFMWGEPPSMAGINLGNVQIFLEQGTPAPQGCGVYFVVGNADELYEYHRANGVEIAVPPGDRPYGLRDYGIRDLNGYKLDFGHHLFNLGPPIEIDRVDVPVRLEKRLAALIQDLAEYKRMSLSSLLEETLLHTLDGVGPHTKSDLKRIVQLKQKHGIDYDSHGSYGFIER